MIVAAGADVAGVASTAPNATFLAFFKMVGKTRDFYGQKKETVYNHGQNQSDFWAAIPASKLLSFPSSYSFSTLCLYHCY